jgi:hypothetical protein
LRAIVSSPWLNNQGKVTSRLVSTDRLWNLVTPTLHEALSSVIDMDKSMIHRLENIAFTEQERENTRAIPTLRFSTGLMLFGKIVLRTAMTGLVKNSSTKLINRYNSPVQ